MRYGDYMSSTDRIACLEITLDDVEPAVMRRLEVPIDIRLDHLHEVLQAAIGWENYHLWEFRTEHGNWGIPDPDWPDGPLDGRTVTFEEVIRKNKDKTLLYLYDFGDGWQHTIRVTDVKDRDPSWFYPVLRDVSGRCPPEDVGGPWGYEEFVEALNDPKHERHQELREWAPDGFDPNDVPVLELEAATAALAKKWRKDRQ